jgi:hypothetical protein
LLLVMVEVHRGIVGKWSTGAPGSVSGCALSLAVTDSKSTDDSRIAASQNEKSASITLARKCRLSIPPAPRNMTARLFGAHKVER